MIYKNLIQGGVWGMSVIYVLWVVVIVLIVKTIMAYVSKKHEHAYLKKYNESILFFGSLAFLFGILYQLMGLMQALKAIAEAGDISPAIMLGGLRVSFIAPIYGFVLFIISFIALFAIRGQIKEIES